MKSNCWKDYPNFQTNNILFNFGVTGTKQIVSKSLQNLVQKQHKLVQNW